MKRVAVITTFVDLLEAFSLCRVVETQVKGLLGAGYATTLLTCNGFRAAGEFANPALAQRRMPHHHFETEASAADRPTEFRAAVEELKVALGPVLREVDVAITHDILFLSHHLAYNVACRELAAEHSHVRWLHCVHSAPEEPRSFTNGDPQAARFTPFPRSVIVYPNAYDVWRVARQFGVDERDVCVVPHALDYEQAFDFHPFTKALARRYDLYSPDVLAIYPLRMDRGKQPEKLVRLFSEIKRAGQSVRLLILCFHSTGQHFLEYREEVRREALELGLDEDEVVFTNRLEHLDGIPSADFRRYRIELPHKVVLDLFHLTNVYVHPSASETYSLVCQEAAACSNLLFLNDDFPPMRDVYGPSATYVKFCSSLFTTTYEPSELAYYAEIARKLVHVLKTERSIQLKTRLRQTRNLGAVFRDHLEPLLYAG